MKRASNITPEMFEHIKILVAGGAHPSKIEEMMGYSRTTIMRIKRCQTFEEFKGLQADYRGNAKTKQEEPKEEPIKDIKMPGGTISAYYQYNKLIELVTKQNELLSLISNKLAAIVEELT